jgi:hypothetical protein
MHEWFRQQLRPRYPASVWLGVGIIVATAMQTQFSGYTKWLDMVIVLGLVVLNRRQCHNEGQEIEREHRRILALKAARDAL